VFGLWRGETKLCLSERTFRCDECGLVLDRDVNAAWNLAALVGEVIGGTSSQSCAGDGNRARWKPMSDPHRVGSGYRHGQAHEVNAPPQGDGYPNRADSHPLTLRVTGSRHGASWVSGRRAERIRGLSARFLGQSVTWTESPAPSYVAISLDGSAFTARPHE
jgi:hypothetical protein